MFEVIGISCSRYKYINERSELTTAGHFQIDKSPKSSQHLLCLFVGTRYRWKFGGGQLDAQEFLRKHPRLARIKPQHRYAFFILSQCMPPYPASISKSELNKLAKRLDSRWARLSKQTHSKYIDDLITIGLFAPDGPWKRFISMTFCGNEYRSLLVSQLSEQARQGDDGQKRASEDLEDSSPHVEGV